VGGVGQAMVGKERIEARVSETVLTSLLSGECDRLPSLAILLQSVSSNLSLISTRPD
jgi:hypothetical protein